MDEARDLRECTKLGEEILDLARITADKVHPIFQREKGVLTLREQVLIGLWRKLYLAFESLVEDAKRGRSESVHHLKTMTESFIYLHYVDKESDDNRAKIVMAEAARQKKNFFEKNPEFPHRDTFLEIYTEKHKGISEEIGKRRIILEKAAEKELDWVYDRVFRMACEPSHITDLPEYMPRSDEAISLEPPKHSIRWALIALYHGTLLMCILLKSLSKLYSLGLDKRIAGVRDNLEGINRKAWEATVKS